MDFVFKSDETVNLSEMKILIKNFFIILLQSEEDCDKINTYRTRNALAKQLSNNIDNLNGGMKLWQRKLY